MDERVNLRKEGQKLRGDSQRIGMIEDFSGCDHQSIGKNILEAIF
jgi:hypothetical protein